jgi:photosystem II stability/assembly factor-like uncharacterized protein
MKSIQRYFLSYIFTVSAANVMNAQWIPTNGPREGLTLSLAASVSNTGDTAIYAGTWNGGVFRTTNKGDNWTEIDGGNWWYIPQDTGFTAKDIPLLATSPNGTGGTCLLAVNSSGHLFHSANGDTNWTTISGNIGMRSVGPIIVNDTIITAGTDSGIFVSSDHGATWTKILNELSTYKVFSLIGTDSGTNYRNFISSTTGGIFVSSNSGTNWRAVNTDILDCYGLTIMHEATGRMNLYGLRSGIYDIFCSTDTGATWTTLNRLDPYTNITVTCLAVHDTIIYFGTDTQGVNFSLNGGTTWTNENSSSPSARTLLVVGPNLFAGGYSVVGSVYRRPLSEMLTRVENKSKQTLSTFFLNQNYPNPFNPSTTISFTIPSRSLVTLKVFDLLGKEVTTIFSKEISAGNHSTQWNASNIASGVYFYRLQSGSFVDIKKLLLLR